ncbi:MAG: hypothetical protein ACR2IE_09835 [Candidatus Sumerlaeaceae bacterium]
MKTTLASLATRSRACATIRLMAMAASVLPSTTAVAAPSSESTTTLYLTLPPDPVTNVWRTDKTTVPTTALPSSATIQHQKNTARFAPDTIKPKAAPAGYGYVWRVVLLIYPSIDCDQTVSGVTTHFTYTMSAAEIAEAETAFDNMIIGIRDGSNNEARIQPTVIIVGRALTALAKFGADVHWPDASITSPELTTYCAGGKADSALVYWPAKNRTTNAAINNPYWGLSYGSPTSYTYNVGYSTVSNISSPMVVGYYPGEVMIHEWMHPTTDYYHVVWGYNVPNLDSAGSYKPCPTCANYAYVSGDGWMPFYRDFLRGTVWNPSASRYEGVPPAAWRSGTPTNYTLPLAAAEEWQLFE